MAFWKEGNQMWNIRVLGESKATFTVATGDHGKTTASFWVPLLNSNGYENSRSVGFFPLILRQCCHQGNDKKTKDLITYSNPYSYYSWAFYYLLLPLPFFFFSFKKKKKIGFTMWLGWNSR